MRNCLKTTTSNEYMFSGCSSLETINTTFPDKNMSSRYLCAGCGNLKNFIVKNASGLSLVGDGIHLFDGCTNLDVWRSEKREEWTEDDRGTFHHKFIGSLTRLAGGDSLFANCKKLKKFVTESMPGLLSHSAGCGAGSMFANCTALTTFCAKSLGSETRISDFPSTNSMFSGCVNLVEVKKEETDTLNSIDISCFVGA